MFVFSAWLSTKLNLLLIEFGIDILRLGNLQYNILSVYNYNYNYYL